MAVATISKLLSREALAAGVNLGEFQSEHQQDGCGDIQCDHSDRVTQILSAQRLLVALAAQGGEDNHPRSRAQIEESRQHRRRDFFQQELREWHTEGVQSCREHGVEYGFMVFAGHNRDVFIGLAKIGKIGERGKHLLMLPLHGMEIIRIFARTRFDR